MRIYKYKLFCEFGPVLWGGLHMAVAASRLSVLSATPSCRQPCNCVWVTNFCVIGQNALCDNAQLALGQCADLFFCLFCIMSGIGESLAKPLNLQITFISRTTPPSSGKCFQLKSEKRNKSMFLFPFWGKDGHDGGSGRAIKGPLPLQAAPKHHSGGR